MYKKCLISTLHCTVIKKHYHLIAFRSTLITDENLAKIVVRLGTVPTDPSNKVLTVYSETLPKRGVFFHFFAKTTYYGQNGSQMARYGPGVFEVIIWPRSKDTLGI